MQLTEGEIRMWLKACYSHAELHSHDLSNKNAALLLGSDNGFLTIAANRIPEGVTKTEERVRVRPTKYSYIEHAERGVIYRASRCGYRTLGLTMVCPWMACADCARAILLSGISKVVSHRQRNDIAYVTRGPVIDVVKNRWQKPVEDGESILQEGGVEVEYYDGLLGVRALVNEQWVEL